MLISSAQLSEIMPRCPKPGEYADPLSDAIAGGEINTVNRAACFLGQLALESGELRYWAELADGSAYEGRKDLGNTEIGDGCRYKGRGPIQLTGRANYRAAAEALGHPLIERPDLVLFPEIGFEVAVWYWTSRDLNRKADLLDVRGITLKVNGGLTHLHRRKRYTHRARVLLSRTGVLEHI